MITEDYVSFEIAKLLKEKGFDCICISYYVDYEHNDIKYSLLGETNSSWESRCSAPTCYSAPTLQMAVKWLREVHNLSIDIDTCIKGFQPYVCYGHADINKAGLFICSIHDNRTPEGTFYKYEDAVEAAIKKCLTYD